MKKIAWFSILAVVLMGVSSFAWAEEGQGPVEKFVNEQANQLITGCQTELDTYCKTVTPGGGRQLACIFAHEDKLSPQCEKALYNSSEEFEIAAAMLNEFAASCQADIEKLCSNIAPGGGRILACLEKNKEKVSEDCKEMMATSGGGNLEG